MMLYMDALNDTELRKSFGSRLKALRKERKLTQKELAAKLDVLPTHLNKYESGLNAPPLGKLVILAQELSVTLDYLVLGNVNDDVPLTNKGLIDRLKLMEGFNRSDQQTIVSVIDAMIAKQHMQNIPSLSAI